MATEVLDMASCLRAIFLVYIFLSFLHIYLYNKIILLVYGIFLLEIEDGVLEFMLVIGVLIMFFLAM